jgi:Family of unknown function (DUF6551)
MSSKRLNEADPMWISCENLSVVWAQAQRPYKESRAREIADNFDPDLFDPLKVTKPNGDGIYHICDGQTRKGAVEMLWGPKQKIPCYVSQEGDPARAAEIFLKTNTSRRSPSSIDNFKVSVTAQRKNEVAVDRIVRHHGYKVDASSAHNSISGVGALLFVYIVCGPSVLNHTLSTLREIWNDDRNAVVGPMLRGMGVFLNEFAAHLNHQRLVEVTKKKWTPGNLLRDAKAHREVHGGTTNDSIVELLTLHYNRNLRGSAPLKRKERKAEEKEKEKEKAA